MIGHIALLGRRGHSDNVPLPFLILKGVGILCLLYMVIVGQIMGGHFQDKANNLNAQEIAVIEQNGGDCDKKRLDKAREEAWNDAMTFNVFRMMANWRRDYLTEQPKCL